LHKPPKYGKIVYVKQPILSKSPFGTIGLFATIDLSRGGHL